LHAPIRDGEAKDAGHITHGGQGRDHTGRRASGRRSIQNIRPGALAAKGKEEPRRFAAWLLTRRRDPLTHAPLTDHQKREAIKRRDHGKETLAEIGRSYNVSGWTIARLVP